MQYLGIEYSIKNRPALDADFIPFGVWAKAYLNGASCPFKIAVERENGLVSVFETKLRGAEFAGLVGPLVDLAAEANLHGVILARVQPHTAHIQPVVGELHLPAVHDLLTENAELIADGIARHAVAKPRRSIHVARRQPPEAAVAEPRVGLHPAQPV